MFDKYFKDVLHLHPSYASFLGDRSSDDRYENWISPEFNKTMHDLIMKYNNELQRIPKRSWTIDDKLMNYTIQSHKAFVPFSELLDSLPISSYSNPILEIAFMESTIYPAPIISRFTVVSNKHVGQLCFYFSLI